MATLTGRIREVVGMPAQTMSGRGQTWLRVEGPVNEKTNRDIIANLSKEFETWKLVRDINGHKMTDYIFIVRSKRGKELGTCQVARVRGARIYNIINVSPISSAEIHRYNQAYPGTVSYEKVL